MEPIQDDVAAIIPDLPFSEEEWYLAYKHLYPDTEAREYARRLVALPGQLRAEAREHLKSDPMHPVPLLYIDHDVLAVLAMVSVELGRRVQEYMEAGFAEGAMNYQRGLLLKRGLPKNADPPEDVRDEVRRFHDEMRADWTASLTRARQRLGRGT